MTLFALTHSSQNNIFRFPLSGPLQIQLQTEFNRQENDFLSNIDEEVPFNGYYTPNEGEIIIIDNFRDSFSLKDAIDSPLSVPLYDNKSTDLASIKALFWGSSIEKGRILIQKFSQNSIISVDRVAFFFSGNTFTKIDSEGVSIEKKLCAVIEDDGSIKFSSFHFLRQIFDMSDYFKDATDTDVSSFANSAALNISDKKKFSESANQFIRKKISSILQSGLLDKIDTSHLQKTSSKFGVDVKICSAGKIIIPEDKGELRKLLKLLDEDYFESCLMNSPYLSSSKRPI